METKDPTGHSLGYTEKSITGNTVGTTLGAMTNLSSEPWLETVSHYAHRKKDAGTALHWDSNVSETNKQKNTQLLYRHFLANNSKQHAVPNGMVYFHLSWWEQLQCLQSSILSFNFCTESRVWSQDINFCWDRPKLCGFFNGNSTLSKIAAIIFVL